MITEEHILADMRVLQLLSQTFPTPEAASTEIINLKAILNLPKGTEHFMADIHGEHEAFLHILRNASGNIKRKVSEIISAAFPQTAILAVTAMGFALVVGILLGILSAVYKDSWIDKLALFLSTLGMSLPSFFAAILMAWFFAYILGEFTHLSMFGNLYTVDDYGTGEYLDLKNLILPALTLGIRPLATLITLTKNSMLEAMSQDYIRTARAKGMRYRRVLFHHALRNAMNPIVTSASGWLAGLMAGAVFVEYVFDWKGMGVVIVDGLEKYDFPVVMGSILFICVLLVVINILTDILYGILDPRVRVNR